MIPVPELVLEFRLTRPAIAYDVRLADVVLLDRDDLTDRPVMNALHRLADARVIPPAQTRHDAQPARACLFTGGHHQLQAGDVDAVRFLAENMLARRDRRLDDPRREVRRRRDQHDVDAAGNDFFVGVKARETTVRRQLALLGPCLQKLVPAGREPFREQVGQGDELNIAAGVHRVDGRLGAPPTTTDQADLDPVAARRVCIGRKHQLVHCRRRGNRRGHLQEFSSRFVGPIGRVGELFHHRTPCV